MPAVNKEDIFVEREELEHRAKKLQAFYDSVERQLISTGAQKRIMRRLELMWELHSLLGTCIAEEEF